MLRNSELHIHRTEATAGAAGIRNLNTTRNNVYFHRGAYGDGTNRPALVSYRGIHTIMPTTGTHPYGTLRLVSTGAASHNYELDIAPTDEICIGGRSDYAL